MKRAATGTGEKSAFDHSGSSFDSFLEQEAILSAFRFRQANVSNVSKLDLIPADSIFLYRVQIQLCPCRHQAF